MSSSPGAFTAALAEQQARLMVMMRDALDSEAASQDEGERLFVFLGGHLNALHNVVFPAIGAAAEAIASHFAPIAETAAFALADALQRRAEGPGARERTALLCVATVKLMEAERDVLLPLVRRTLSESDGEQLAAAFHASTARRTAVAKAD